MRLAALAAIAIAGPAAAQTYAPGGIEALQAENRMWAEQELMRQQSLAAGRQAFAAEQRARTAAALETLRATQRVAQMSAEPLPPAPLDPAMEAEAAAIARLQDRVLAQSNARIRAIKPASEE